jgi:hypothetical protein
MHIKNIVFIHEDDPVEVAQGRFTDKGSDVDPTRLESGMSFLQVKASMTMKEKLRQVRNAICVSPLKARGGTCRLVREN